MDLEKTKKTFEIYYNRKGFSKNSLICVVLHIECSYRGLGRDYVLTSIETEVSTTTHIERRKSDIKFQVSSDVPGSRVIYKDY